MTDSEILLRASAILREICEEQASCLECPLCEDCKECDIDPHQLIKSFHYDLFIKPLFEKRKEELKND